MYLKSLTLKGFKSFAEKTVFVFEPGVTAIVGPNGSGKSNVVDALAWVMGEQGVKTLRGGKMDDVIFAGTARKGPLGRAEVILTIDNSDGALPIEYSEVTISRTLFRSGGSEYAINGEHCRLLDVQELLSDSGLGREMHVIVGQGQLDAVLRATPEDRRGFIEEAAGILKHRRRKERTERKLEAMQANVQRVNDLAGELRRQLKPLGAQAEIAREAQTIQATARDARSRLLADDLVTLRGRLEQHAAEDAARRSDRSLLQEQLDSLQSDRRVLEQALVSETLDAARATTFELRQVQERFRSMAQVTENRIAMLSVPARQSDLSPEETLKSAHEAQSEAQRLNERATALVEGLALARATTQQRRADLEAIDRQIAERTAAITTYDRDRQKLVSAVELSAGKLASLREETDRQAQAQGDAQRRIEAASVRLEQAETALEDEDGGPQLDLAYRDARTRVEQFDERVAAARASLRDVERDRDTATARQAALALVLERRSGSDDILDGSLRGMIGPVADSLRVEAGYEVAIAAALGSLAEAVLAEDRPAALGAAEFARANSLGAVDVVIARVDAASLGADAPHFDVEGVVPAHGVIEAPTGVLGVLAHTYIADDVPIAERAMAQLSADPAQSSAVVVTKDGVVLTTYRVHGGSSAGQSRLELIAERDAAAAEAARLSGVVAAQAAVLAQHGDELASAKVAQDTALAALRGYDAKRAERDDAVHRSRIQVETLQHEIERLARLVTSSAEQARSAEESHDAARRALAQFEAAPRPSEVEGVREPAVAALDGARAAELDARVALETARERAQSQRQRAESLERRVVQEREALDAAATAEAIRMVRLEQASALAAVLPRVLEHLGASVAQAQLAQEREEQHRRDQSSQLQQIRLEIEGMQSRLASLTEAVHTVELNEHDLKLRMATLQEHIAELSIDEATLIEEYGPEVPVPFVEVGESDGGDGVERAATKPYVRSEQQQVLRVAERKLSQLGRVNPLALEEFAALEQRHAFLTEQLFDLQQTKKNLVELIGDLEEKMQAIFEDAFADTKQAFAQVFPILFPGGTGSIELSDPAHPLTSGIEVFVKPAGKKIDRLSLLSGGERSLAAVALLVAIFKARPSPFYVMDEVEAALDDSNLGRLLEIFSDLRAGSQLIIVTHQKRTMEIADALYGVSMRQNGISTVVGQRLEHEADEDRAVGRGTTGHDRQEDATAASAAEPQKVESA